MNPKCARCEKSVYPTEELRCLDKIWHKLCFKCQECNMTLNMRNYKGFDKLPYCNAHVPKAKATIVSETPEMKRLAENSKLQSQVLYHSEFEKAKGHKISVVDDPETLRNRQNMQDISGVAYKGLREKVDEMEKRRPKQTEVRNQPVTGGGYAQSSTVVVSASTGGSNAAAHPHASSSRPAQGATVFLHKNGKVDQPEEPKKAPVQHKRDIGSIFDYDPVADADKYTLVSSGGEAVRTSRDLHQLRSSGNAPPQPDVIPEQSREGHYRKAKSESPGAAAGSAAAAVNIGAEASPTMKENGPPSHLDPHPTHFEPAPCSQPVPAAADAHANRISVEKETEAAIAELQQAVGDVNISAGASAEPDDRPASMTYNQIVEEHNESVKQKTDAAADAAEPTSPMPSGRIMTCRALYDYEAGDTDEISFTEGELLVNCQLVAVGWMTGVNQRTQEAGLLPANYVESVD